MSVLLRRYYQLLGNSLCSWLSSATKQAIMAAFGNDGAAVIKATNDYLNGIAQTDLIKARALADLINEDVMVVCSLGLQPKLTVLPSMPMRLMIGSGSSYIVTDYYPNLSSKIEIVGEQDRVDAKVWFGLSAIFYCFSGITGAYYGFDSQEAALPSTFVGMTTLIMNKDGVWINGEKKTTISGATAFTAEYSMSLYGRRNNDTGAVQYLGAHKICRAKLDEGTTAARLFVPIKRNEVMEFIDGYTKNVQTRKGTFTETFGYMQNGQWVPWTPGTPIP